MHTHTHTCQIQVNVTNNPQVDGINMYDGVTFLIFFVDFHSVVGAIIFFIFFSNDLQLTNFAFAVA